MCFYVRWNVPTYSKPNGVIAFIEHGDLFRLLYDMDAKTGLPIRNLIGLIFLTHGSQDEWLLNIPGAAIEVYEH